MNKLDHYLANRLDRDFFNQPTLKVAQNLIGKYLICTKNGYLQVGQITETEAYIGTEDLASHARFGITSRNKIMWGQSGIIYVYLIYGIHNLINIITESEGYPAAVLLRSLKPIIGIDIKTDGPAKICKALKLSRTDTGTDLINNPTLFISDLHKTIKIIKKPRVGIAYAGKPWVDKKWRFVAA